MVRIEPIHSPLPERRSDDHDPFIQAIQPASI